MNRPIRRVAVAVIVMIVLLLANATYVQVFQADALRNDPFNSRMRYEEYSRQRGLIVAADGTVLAESVPTDDDLKYLRRYPTAPNAFAPVTGFFSVLLKADRGLEHTENSILSGTDDRLFTQRFMDMFSGRDPRGGNVVTTIDPKLQQAAFRALRGGDCDGPCRGAVVALEPSTGKILAMVSTPSYDPNELANPDTTATRAAWDALNPDDPSSPLINRAITALYPPGSTFKVVTTAAGLEHGLDANTRLTSAAQFRLPGTTTDLPNDSNAVCPGGTAGTVSLLQAFQYSCNTAFAQLVTQKLGDDPVDEFAKAAAQFGLDSKPSGIPLQVSTSTIGDIGDDDLAMLAQSSIGQRDVKLTVLQNAMIAAAVANGGVRMRPYLVDKLQTADLRTVSSTSPSAVNRPLTPDQAATLTDMMIRSEQETAGAQPGIASKTGTAERGEAGASTYAWYIGFSPSSNARIAVAVVVENGSGGANSYGGVVAAPIGREVMNAYTGGAR